jgi:hypothetical protein
MKNWKNLSQLMLSASVWFIFIRLKHYGTFKYVWSMIAFSVSFTILFVILGLYDSILLLLSYLKISKNG